MRMKYLTYFNTSYYIMFNFTPITEVILSLSVLLRQPEGEARGEAWGISMPPLPLPPPQPQAQTQISNVGILTLVAEEEACQGAGQASSWDIWQAPSPAGTEGRERAILGL